MLGSSYFLKLILRTIFKNIKNIIFVFFENCFGYLNLIYIYIYIYCVFCFFQNKKKIMNQNMFFLLFLFFKIKNCF